LKNIKITKPVSSKQQFKINSSVILNYLRENSPISRKQISNDLRVSGPVVTKAIENFINEGLVNEIGKVKTKSGKRPTMLEFNGSDSFVIGIDLGKEELRMALIDFNGKLVEKYIGFEIKQDISNLDKKICNEIKKFLKKIKNKKFLRQENIKGICIGFPSSINKKSGKIIKGTLYRNWTGLNFEDVLENEFNAPIYIENDVNLSAVAENKFGKGKEYKDIVFIEVSNGIGVGIIIEDHIFQGSKGSAGEIAYKIINRKNLEYKLTDKGFFEANASMEVLREKIIEIKKGKEKSFDKDELNNEKKELYKNMEKMINDSKPFKEVLNRAIELLSICLIDLTLILDPGIIVIGGDILNLPLKNKNLLKPLTENLNKIVPFKAPKIEFSSIGEDACVIGASDYAIDSEIIKKFPYEI